MDRERLIKLLNMTQSSHDAEALSAIRMSNTLLRQAKTSWTDLIAVAAEQPPAAEPAPPSPEPVYQREKPAEPKSPTWGQDLFGDQPSITPSAYPDRRRDKRKEEKRTALRSKIRSVPLWLRLPLFPIWVSAEAYARMVHAEAGPAKIVGFIPLLVASGLSGGIWLLIVGVIAKKFGYQWIM